MNKIALTNRVACASRPLLALALLGASFGTHAAGLPERAATGVGLWIAAQGNAALDQIADDLRREIERQIKPLLPQPTAPAEPVAG